MTTVADAMEWAQGVVDGDVVACKYVRQACARHFHDLEHGPARGLVFDESAAQNHLDFFAEMLVHFEGRKWAGKPIILGAWQAFIHSNIFGWKNKETGLRRFREVYDEEARGNGKTTRLGGVGLYCLTCDGEPAAQIYSVATKREQANISHRAGRLMAKANPELAAELIIFPKVETQRVQTGVISYPAEDAYWKTLGRDSKTDDGLNPYVGLVDELHAHPNRGAVEILTSATGKRDYTLMYYITTAGFNQDSVCIEYRDYARKVLAEYDDPNGHHDDTFFGIIFTLDGYDEKADPDNPRDDPFDESVWQKANPNLGISVDLDNFKAKAKKAKASPASLNGFLTKNCNVWTSQAVAWMPMQHWRDTPVNLVTLEDLRGRVCWGGLDLASTSDICALIIIADSLTVTGGIDVFCRFYVPREAVDDVQKRGTDSYQLWESQGWLTVTDGNTTDYAFIKHDIVGAPGKRKECIANVTQLQDIGYDRWGANKLVIELGQEGVEMTPIGQGFASMSAPMKEMDTLVRNHKINHGGNPVLSWMAGNVAAATDPSDNVKPDKAASKKKIDGIVGLIMAISRWTVSDKRGTVHDSGEIMFI